jgi:phosphoserine aminotransferase
MKKYNFYAGPGILPREVIEESAKGILDFNNIGLSIIEISHRSKDFEAVLSEAKQHVKDLLMLNDDYEVLFLQGGASLQFCMIPYNLLNENETATYLETGVWAKGAIKEAKMFGNVNVVASSADKNFSYIPKNYTIPADSKYFHITTNNTIYGSELFDYPKTNVPVIADMSSDIFSRPIDGKQFALIYAGAQKNMGASGATMVAIRKDILGKVNRKIPSILNYALEIEKESMLNTPCTFAIYVSNLTLRWLKKTGLENIEKLNKEKSDTLYHEIDTNPLFEGVIAKEDRSRMNVTFVIKKKELEEEFLNYTKGLGIVGIKGHRSTGGFRASLYNAMTIDGVKVLVGAMREFAKKHG